MILKKPYAFLIRHFKLIHLILVVLLCFIFSRSLNIINFFNEYIANGYKPTSSFNLVETYVPASLIIMIIAVIIITTVLVILLEYKQKPNKIYGFMILYYIVLLALFVYAQVVLNRLSIELISATLSRVIRDVSILYAIPQIPIIVIMFVRTIGFNLKKFAFESDFKEMNYTYSDSEEVEVGLNLNSYKFRRRIRKSLREFKYYIVENRFVVTIIVIIAVAFLGYTAYTYIRPSYERHLTLGSSFIYNNYEIVIEDGMLTSVDYRGDEIKPGKYYVVLKAKVTNRLSAAGSFDFNVIKLQTRNGIVSPKQSLSRSFIDFANADESSYLFANETREFAIVYEIDSSEIQDSYKAVVTSGIAMFKGDVYNRIIYINFTPKINNAINSHNYNLADVISFDDYDLLKGNKLSIKSYSIQKSIKYSYDSCTKDNCVKLYNIVNVSAFSNRQSNYLINIIGTYENNNNSAKYKSFRSLIDKNASIEYTINDEIKRAEFIDVTPDNYTGGVILEISGEVKEASKINLIINTRNNRYIINLK